jgi:hypothetical protein
LQVPVTQPVATPTTLSTNSSFVYFQGIAVNGSTVVFTVDDSAFVTTSTAWKAQVGVANQSLSALDTFNPGQLSGPAFNPNGATFYIVEYVEDSGGNHNQGSILYACPIGSANACSSLTSSSTNYLGGPVFSGNAVFFDDGTNNEIEKFPLPSGPVNGSYVSPLPLTPGAMAADSSRIYFTYNPSGLSNNLNTEGIINNSTNGSAQPQGFSTATGTATGLASDGKFLYFAYTNYNNSPSTGVIEYASVTGGPVTTLYTGTAPHALIAANGGVYWIDGQIIYGQRVP